MVHLAKKNLIEISSESCCFLFLKHKFLSYLAQEALVSLKQAKHFLVLSADLANISNRMACVCVCIYHGVTNERRATLILFHLCLQLSVLTLH